MNVGAAASSPRLALAQAASVNVANVAALEELTKVAVAAQGTGARSDTGDSVAPSGSVGTLGDLNTEAIASLQHALGLSQAT